MPCDEGGPGPLVETLPHLGLDVQVTQALVLQNLDAAQDIAELAFQHVDDRVVAEVGVRPIENEQPLRTSTSSSARVASPSMDVWKYRQPSSTLTSGRSMTAGSRKNRSAASVGIQII
jgi:hypothetical protein